MPRSISERAVSVVGRNVLVALAGLLASFRMTAAASAPPSISIPNSFDSPLLEASDFADGLVVKARAALIEVISAA
jgi:hypothetical protein